MGMFRLATTSQWIATGANSWYREPKPQTPEPVKSSVDDGAWQMFRGCRLKGQATEVKLSLLHAWLSVWIGTPYEALAQVQVENYLGALKRGGFIKESSQPGTYIAPLAKKVSWHVGTTYWVVIK